jgi:dolichol-phosphate mannosyltransferase
MKPLRYLDPTPNPEVESSIELAVVVPTYCERDNVVELVARLQAALEGIRWEAIFVDDDSPDDTAAAVRAIGHVDARVRCLQRIGRRGLSSACIEGILASVAPVIAVMDADLQHDETRLPLMLERIRRQGADLVVATRYAEDNGVDTWDPSRAKMSATATRLSRFVNNRDVSDPMSGFFMLKRGLFESVMRDLSAMGFKLLLDILATAKQPVTISEVPYTFRNRSHGHSKLDTLVLWDFGMLLLDKLMGRYVPARFVAFGLVGGSGILVHLAVAAVLIRSQVAFLLAQTVATATAMVFNYAVNNILTYRDLRRTGLAWLTGLISFAVGCSFGALLNVAIAAYLYEKDAPWMLAAFGGILVGAVWNYAVAARWAWSGSLGRRPRP